MTMNGGTSLRREGVKSRFAASSIVLRPSCAASVQTAPLLPHSLGQKTAADAR
jgi:hypothetical protein